VSNPLFRPLVVVRENDRNVAGQKSPLFRRTVRLVAMLIGLSLRQIISSGWSYSASLPQLTELLARPATKAFLEQCSGHNGIDPK